MMPISTLNLTHVQYTQLDPMTWCATAQVSECLSIDFQNLRNTSLRSVINPLSRVSFHKLYKLNWHYYLPSVILSTREIAQHQRQLQRKGVRLLLQQLLDELKLSDILDESNFPYRLIGSKY